MNVEKNLVKKPKLYVYYNKDSKKKDALRVSIQIKWGRSNMFRHKTDIVGNFDDLECIETNGVLKPRVKKESAIILQIKIQKELDLCERVLNEIDLKELSNVVFEQKYIEVTQPQTGENKDSDILLERFEAFINERTKLTTGTIKQYRVLRNVLERFLIIKHNKNLKIKDFTPEIALEFSEYYKNEYQYVEKYSALFENTKSYGIPTEPRASNTTNKKNQQMKAFFAYIDVPNNPYKNKIVKRQRIFKEEYDEPIELTFEEFSKLTQTKVAPKLQVTKDAFITQCMLGMRIGDFARINKDNIKISIDGIPYVRYLPRKTRKQKKKPVDTPLTRYAFDTMNKYDFSFPILRNISGKEGYNKQIKELFAVCGLNREIDKYDEDGNITEKIPLYEEISNKYARKVFIDFTTKVQIDPYIMGLHQKGSKAVDHYTDADKNVAFQFNLLNFTFNQKPYKVDKNLNII